MGDALAAVVAIFALAIGVAALFAVLQILYPRSIADARAIYEVAPRRCFWFGLVNFILFAILAQVGAAIGQESGGDGGVLGILMALPAPAWHLVRVRRHRQNDRRTALSGSQ